MGGVSWGRRRTLHDVWELLRRFVVVVDLGDGQRCLLKKDLVVVDHRCKKVPSFKYRPSYSFL